jgi:hypothetical protein
MPSGKKSIIRIFENEVIGDVDIPSEIYENQVVEDDTKTNEISSHDHDGINSEPISSVNINGKVSQIFYSATAPTSGMVGGDFWMDSDDKKWYRYSGTAWVEVQDADILLALNNAADAQSAADDAQADATTALAELDDIAADTKITPVEKLEAKKIWDEIVVEGTATTGTIPAQAIAFGVSHTNFDTAYAALNTYLNTTLEVFDDMEATTTIVRADWNTAWNNYYNQRTLILNAIASKAKDLADAAQADADTAIANAATAQSAADDAQTDATTALGELDDIGADAKITPVEKQEAKQKWDVIAAEKSGIDTQADTYSVSKTAYDNAYTALNTYLNTTLNVFADMTSTTDITRATWNTNWETYYQAKIALLQAIADATALLASWDSVTGDNKPEDNADVTPPLPSDENLVGYWAFDEGTGLKAFDSSGNDNTGTLTNMDNNDWVAGVVGNALDFDGSNDYVNCGDLSDVDFGSGNFSFSAWVKRDIINANHGVIGKDSTGQRQFVFYITSSNTIRISYFVSGVVVYLDTIDTIDTAWHHIVGQRNGNSFEIYIDGVLSKSGTTGGSHGTMDSCSSLLTIGLREYGSYYMDGKMDEVRIYNRALTASEVKALYLNPSGAKKNTTYLAVDRLLAGKIDGQDIELDAAAADVGIRAGISAGDFDNAGANEGFLLGRDYSDSNKGKLFVGNSTEFFKFDGTRPVFSGQMLAPKGSLLAGVDLTAGKIVHLGYDGYVSYMEQTKSDDQRKLYYNTDQFYYYQQIVMPRDIGIGEAIKVQMYLNKSGTPAAGIHIVLYSDQGDDTPGEGLDTSNTIAPATVSGKTLVSFYITTTTTYTAGTKYWIKMSPEQGSLSTINYFTVYCQSVVGGGSEKASEFIYPFGILIDDDETTIQGALYFKFQVFEVEGSVYPCSKYYYSSDGVSEQLYPYGVVVSATDKDEVVEIQIGGTITGTFDINKTYFVNENGGLTAGSFTKNGYELLMPVAKSISTTQAILFPDFNRKLSKSATLILSSANSTTTEITLPFIPRAIIGTCEFITNSVTPPVIHSASGGRQFYWTSGHYEGYYYYDDTPVTYDIDRVISSGKTNSGDKYIEIFISQLATTGVTFKLKTAGANTQNAAAKIQFTAFE